MVNEPEKKCSNCDIGTFQKVEQSSNLMNKNQESSAPNTIKGKKLQAYFCDHCNYVMLFFVGGD